MLSEKSLKRMEEFVPFTKPPRWGPLTLEEAKAKIASVIADDAVQIAADLRAAYNLQWSGSAMLAELIRITQYACPNEPCDCAESKWARPIREVIATARAAGWT